MTRNFSNQRRDGMHPSSRNSASGKYREEQSSRSARPRLSRDAVEHIVRKYTLAASKACASLAGKRVSPHVLRHSTAMDLLQNGVDRTVIALWLGHESVETTQMYVHADMRLKEKALARVASTASRPGRYKPDDALLSFLEAL